MPIRSRVRSRVRSRALAGVVAVALAAVPLAAAPPAHAADPQHDPVVDCKPNWRYLGVITFAGYATVPTSHNARVRALTVTCTYYNEAGAYMSTNTAPSPAVATFGAGALGAGTMVFCGYASVTYEDGHTASTSTPCTIS